MKRLIKTIKSSRIFHYVIASILANYIKLVFATSRNFHMMPDSTAPYLCGEKNAIFALWHSRIALIPALNQRQIKLAAIVSKHNDGRIIGRILSHFGVKAAYGSSSSGGSNAMRQLIELYQQGSHIAITPDGPRGPNQIAATGVAQFAMLLDAPIICISASASRSIRLKSWDKFIVPLPFSKIYFAYSEPIFYENANDEMKKISRETLRLYIQNRLNELTEIAQKNVMK
jgi:lysophospholipid acyltransferase (LPLAT)-like uncharacterized protein